MVYLDESGGQVQAGLVVFTCAPNSDTASVEDGKALQNGMSQKTCLDALIYTCGISGSSQIAPANH